MIDDKIREIISTEVATAVHRSMMEMFGSIKTAMIELLDDHYTALSEAAVVVAIVTVCTKGIRGERSF